MLVAAMIPRLPFFSFLLLLLSLLPPSLRSSRARSATPEVRSAIRCDLCKALILEVHAEVHRFGLRADGEEAILDTIEPGCLGVVQNYTLTLAGAASSLSRTLKDEYGEPLPGQPPFDFEAGMALRLACEEFGDEAAVDMSEALWKRAMTWTGADLAKSFCHKRGGCGRRPGGASSSRSSRSRSSRSRSSSKKKNDKREDQKEERGGDPGDDNKGLDQRGAAKADKKQARRRAKQAKRATRAKRGGDAPSRDRSGSPRAPDFSLEEAFQTLDRDGTISSLLQREREEPDMMLPDADRAHIRAGRRDIACELCGRAVREAERGARRKRSLGRQRQWVVQEDDVMDAVSGVCGPAPDEIFGDTDIRKNVAPWMSRCKVKFRRRKTRRRATDNDNNNNNNKQKKTKKETKKESSGSTQHERRRTSTEAKTGREGQEEADGGRWVLLEAEKDDSSPSSTLSPPPPPPGSPAEVRELKQLHMVSQACRDAIVGREDTLAEDLYKAMRALPAGRDCLAPAQDADPECAAAAEVAQAFCPCRRGGRLDGDDVEEGAGGAARESAPAAATTQQRQQKQQQKQQQQQQQQQPQRRRKEEL